MTVISENAQNGKISPKTHKNTPEVSQFYAWAACGLHSSTEIGCNFAEAT